MRALPPDENYHLEAEGQFLKNLNTGDRMTPFEAIQRDSPHLRGLGKAGVLIQQGMDHHQARALGRAETVRLEAARVVERMKERAKAAKNSKCASVIDIKVEDFDNKGAAIIEIKVEDLDASSMSEEDKKADEIEGCKLNTCVESETLILRKDRSDERSTSRDGEDKVETRQTASGSLTVPLPVALTQMTL